MQSCHGLQGLAIPQGRTLHLLCAEGAEAFEALPNAVRGMGPWTGGPEGAIDRLRLRLRVMLNQQGFAVILRPSDAAGAGDVLGQSRRRSAGKCGMPSMPRGRPRGTAWRAEAEDLPSMQWSRLDQGSSGRSMNWLMC